jgi:hypothetical protein
LTQPVVKILFEAFDLRFWQQIAVSDHVAGAFQLIQADTDPILAWEQLLKLLPLRNDYEGKITKKCMVYVGSDDGLMPLQNRRKMVGCRMRASI